MWFAILSVSILAVTTGCGGVHLNSQSSGSPGTQAAASIQVSPSTVSFGAVTVGQTATSLVTVANDGKQPLTISQLSLPGHVFWLANAANPPVQIAAGSSQKFSLDFKPSSATAYSGQLSIQSNAANTPAFNVPISGSGTNTAAPAAAQIALSTSSIDFGNLSTGASSTKTLTLTSTGTAAVKVNSVAVSGKAYSISGANFPLSISPSQQVVLQVTFKPAAAGSSVGQIAVDSDATNEPAATVSLSGSGTSPVATTPQLTVSAGALSFGSVVVGSPSMQTLTLTSSGTASVTVNSVNLTGAAFSVSGATFPLTLDPGESSALQIQFKPTATGSATGQITVKSDSENAASEVVKLSGTGTAVVPTTTTPQLTLSSAGLNFGNVSVGSSSVLALTLSSTGSAAVTVNSVSLSGAAYSISGATFPVTIAPNLQVTLKVQFKPTASGAATGQIAVTSTSTANPSAMVALSGSGTATTPQLSVSSPSLNFGNVTVGSSAAQTLTLTSSGTAAVTVKSASLSGAAYSFSGATFPLSLASGQSVALQVLFKPSAAGAAGGAIAISSTSASNPATNVALRGTGTTSKTPPPGPATGTALSACADLTTGGTYYLSQDVSSPGTCFFIDADNITLNLNGHTITYGTGGGSAGTPGVLLADSWYTGGGSFSIAKTGSTNAHGGFEIYNGTIQSSPSAALQSRGIWVGQSGDISPAPKVHDLTINTTAVDANPIFGDSSLSGWQIYNNTLSYGATGSSAISSRFELFGYAIWLADTLNAPGAIPDQIYSNHIVAAPQGGIYDTNQNNQVHDNDITFNSYFSNDYCVAAISGNGAKVSNNNCHPTSGRGYDIEASNVTLTNNTAVVTELSQNNEYGGCELGGADGIRIKDNFNTPSGGAPAPPSGAVVSGNVITAQATVCQANALRLSFLYPLDSATISGNSFTSTGGGSIDFAISFDQVTLAPLTFSGNTFNAHLAHIQIDYDGVLGGLIQSGQTWAGSPQYSIYDIDGGADLVNLTHPALSTLTIEDAMPSTKFCGGVSLSTLLLGGLTLACP